MPGQFVADMIDIGEFTHATHRMGQDHPLEALIGCRILDQAHERGKPGAGGEQIEVAAGAQIIQQQSAGGLAPHKDNVADL